MRLLKLSAGFVALGCSIAASAYAGPDQSVQVGVATGATVESHPGETPHANKPADVHAKGTVSAHVAASPALGLRLQPLLPAGMTLDAAARGFRTEGQFIAALHVSSNLGIPFDRLKAEITGTAHDSLGQAIHNLNATVDARAEAQKAETQAKADVQASTHPTLAQRIEANAALAERLRPLLAGVSLDIAANGFGNEAQFVAALHASSNVGVPFDRLKARITGTAHESLEQGIHALKATADARAEAQTAESQARADMQATTKVEAMRQAPDKDRGDR
jgi:hypothetical protein